MFIMVYDTNTIEIYNEYHDFIDDIFIDNLKVEEIADDKIILKLCQDGLDNNNFTEVEYQIYKRLH